MAVHRLVEQGHDLTLFYIRIGMDRAQGGNCSTEEDLDICSLIAARYGLPLEVVDLQQEYWDNVMDYALDQVRRGLTPNPDVMCNRMIKFGFFEERWGHCFDLTATGHYANTVTDADGRIWLATAPDPVKDQTDFLARITYSQLSHLCFPIGALPKSEVRRIAAEQKLPNAARRDSQGICFLGKIDYNEFLRSRLGEAPGPIIDLATGRKLGEHRGVWFHTIGQRKGLGLSGGPWYVVQKDVEQRTLWVAGGFDAAEQYGTTLHVADMHWITACPWPQLRPDAREEPVARIAFKNRHSPESFDATLTRLPDSTWRIDSQTPVQGIAPGQFTTIYTPDRRLCLGSAVIIGLPLE